MTDTTPETARDEQKSPRAKKHVHHGRTPAAWAGSIITLVAFVIGAIGLVLANWVVFWVAVALVAVALIVTLVLQKAGYGAV